MASTTRVCATRSLAFRWVMPWLPALCNGQLRQWPLISTKSSRYTCVRLCNGKLRQWPLISTKSSRYTCAYLDDWLLWNVRPHQVQPILAELQHLGLTINLEKSIIQPSTALTYLGLRIDTMARTLTPTSACVRHLRDLLSIVPEASPQDL
jgi:hypothetical protein